ncbi:topoisomerase I [Vibrio sp. 16]|uniref:topoisomerase I n=1 Tax=Vibrio sp. 16 TaxID=391586 RepID=UPI002FF00F72
MTKRNVIVGVSLALGVLYLGLNLMGDEGVQNRPIESSSDRLSVTQDAQQPLKSEHATPSANQERANDATDTIVEELTLPETAWLSDPINQLSNDLYDFIESEQVRYINTTDYPFDEEKDRQLNALIQAGEMIMFDNTDPDYLDSYGVSEAQVVSEYFGTASKGDVIVATAVVLPEGGMHYLVLPLQRKSADDDATLISDVKQAVTLLKDQKFDLVKPRSTEPGSSDSAS